jgi:hypothetical protein
MRRQELHDDDGLRLVEEQDLRYHAGVARTLALQRVILEE